MSRVIVCDTGPLLHLSEAEAIYLLKMAGGIFIPPAVATEFARNLPSGELPDWIQIHELTVRYTSQVTKWIRKDYIDIGEAEAIGLALQQHSNWFLTDDAEARRFAERLGLEVHGSIGLLLWAVASGCLENRAEAYRILNALHRSSLWVSERVISQAAKAIDVLTSE